MVSLTLLIVVVFVIGYLCIALEGFTKINKAAIALLMFVGCWTLFMINPGEYIAGLTPETTASTIAGIIDHHLGGTAETLFFLMGAMTIVEVVDKNGGFNFVRDILQTRGKRTLLWRIVFITFFLSAILDNLTTSIVMIMVLRKLVPNHKDRMIYASLVIIAANSGGAFSPIGDVTTIMLWNKGVITAAGVMEEIFIPSLVSMIIPTLLLQRSLKGELALVDSNMATDYEVLDFSKIQRKIIFALGVGGLIFVPIFKSITHLPPFVGILLVLGVLWTATEIFYRAEHGDNEGIKHRVANLIAHIEMSTILFFLGILMAVACLEEIKVLENLGIWLNDVSAGNHFIVTGLIGVLSSIVDNVPLVAGCMGMYTVTPTGDMAVDGIFWQLLAYCAGVGGSILIIGSAAGWYLKRVAGAAFVGYLAGILCYWVIRTYLW